MKVHCCDVASLLHGCDDQAWHPLPCLRVVVQGVCTLHYKGPLPIGYGLRAAVRDKFPDIMEVRRAALLLADCTLLHLTAALPIATSPLLSCYATRGRPCIREPPQPLPRFLQHVDVPHPCMLSFVFAVPHRLSLHCCAQVLMIDPDTQEPIKFEAI